MTNVSVTDAILAAEVPKLARLAERFGWQVDLRRGAPALCVSMRHGKTGDVYILHADLSGYKSVPAEWTFIEPGTNAVGTLPAFPAPPNPPPGGSAIFIMHNGRPLICLPCNRLAYAAHSGPHNDWQLANWTNVQPELTTLSEIVTRIHTEMQLSASPWGTRIA